MTSTDASQAFRVRVVLSEDALQAWLAMPSASLPDRTPPDEEEVMAALADEKIAITDEVRARVAAFLQIVGADEDGVDDDLGGPREWPERYLVAQGCAPIEAVDSTLEWFEEHKRVLPDWQADASFNYYALNSILTLAAGTSIGHATEAVDGKPGVDVRGREISPKRRKSHALLLGHGLRLAEDQPNVVVCDVAGRVVQDRWKLRMDEVLTIAGDVAFESGNVDSMIDVHIRGGVKPRFVVRSRRSIVVDQAVGAAALEAGGDINVRRGIFGHDSGRKIVAAGMITTRICDGSYLDAVGDIRVIREIVNSSVRTHGVLNIEHGVILGGDVWARQGLTAKTIGSDACVATRVAVGVDGAVLAANRSREKKIEQLRARAEKMRARINPLTANNERPTFTRRDSDPELMRKCDTINRAAKKLQAECAQALKKAVPAAAPGVHVTGMVYPGVCVAFGTREAMIQDALKGPLRFEERSFDGESQVVIVNTQSGSITPLPTRPVDLTRFDAIGQEGKKPR